ncbi:MAG TPA: hypothetical protein QF665_00715 [Alphaproteobacteria bacterium]|jgi:hypothetical protein|nr:hypothetical protein [Alphaproteobacteria bacterium]
MKTLDRMLLAVVAAGLWTMVVLYVLAPSPVAADHEPAYPRNSGDLVDFIWRIVEEDCVSYDDGFIECGY